MTVLKDSLPSPPVRVGERDGVLGRLPPAGGRQCLIERSELEGLRYARPAGAVEEPAHLLVHEVAGREYDALGMPRIVAAQSLEQLLTGEIGHAHVDDDRIVLRILEPGERIDAARGGLDMMAAPGQIALQRHAHGGLVVYDQDAE